MQLGDPELAIDTGRLRGRWRGASAAFLGIPFAQPPVGSLRFAAPLPVEPWDGVREAVEHGPTPQRGDPPLETLIPEPSIPGDATLNLDVFTPAPGDRQARLPVLVWIHGGGYTGGSPASPWYDGAAFNRDGIVTVTISYRLGFDGFGWIEGAPSNRGVRDWLLALDWVQRNILAFGGDPDRVTIAGQSAGGGAVLTLLGMPAARGLFQRAWAMSAAPADVTVERARAVARRLATAAGVQPDRQGFASLPEERILALQSAASIDRRRGMIAVARTLLTEGAPLGPVVDGELVARPVVQALAAGQGAQIPLVLGSTDDEFSMLFERAGAWVRWVPAGLALALLGVSPARRRAYLAANPGPRGRGTSAMLGRYVSDMAFRSTVARVAAARESAGAPSWVYRFAWTSPTTGWAQHCLDVPFFFDCLDAPRVEHIAGHNPPQQLARALHGAAVGFIRDGEPGWAPWSEQPGLARAFGGFSELDPHGYASVLPLLS